MPLYTEIYRKNAADQNRAADFVRACAVETDINMSEEPLYTEIYREKAAGQNFAPAIFSLGVRKRRKPFLEVSQIAQLGSPDSQPTPRRRSRYDPPRVQEAGPEKGKCSPKVVFVVVSKYFPISHILDDHHAPHLLSEFSRVDADSSSCTLHLS